MLLYKVQRRKLDGSKWSCRFATGLQRMLLKEQQKRTKMISSAFPLRPNMYLTMSYAWEEDNWF